jgi:hypothetical protein
LVYFSTGNENKREKLPLWTCYELRRRRDIRLLIGNELARTQQGKRKIKLWASMAVLAGLSGQLATRTLKQTYCLGFIRSERPPFRQLETVGHRFSGGVHHSAAFSKANVYEGFGGKSLQLSPFLSTSHAHIHSKLFMTCKFHNF